MTTKKTVSEWLTDLDNRHPKACLVVSDADSIRPRLSECFREQGGAIEVMWFSPTTQRLRHELELASICPVTPLGARKVFVLDGFEYLMNDAQSSRDVHDFFKSGGGASRVPVVCLARRSRTAAKKFLGFYRVRDRAGCLVVDDDDDEDTEGKEKAMEAYEVVDRALRGRMASVTGAVFDARFDPTVVSLGVFERYRELGPSPRATADLTETYSVADVFESRHVDDALLQCVQVGGPCVWCADRGLETPKKDKKEFVFGMLWSKAHLTASRMHIVRNAQAHLLNTGCLPMPTTDMQLACRLDPALANIAKFYVAKKK